MEKQVDSDFTIDDVVELIKTTGGLPKDFQNNGKNAFTAYSKHQQGQRVVELYRNLGAYVDGLTDKGLAPNSITNYLDYLTKGLKHLEPLRQLFDAREVEGLRAELKARAKAIRCASYKGNKRSKAKSTAVVIKETSGSHDSELSDAVDTVTDGESVSSDGGRREEWAYDKMADSFAAMDKTMGLLVTINQDLLHRLDGSEARTKELELEVRTAEVSMRALTDMNARMRKLIEKMPDMFEDGKLKDAAMIMGSLML